MRTRAEVDSVLTLRNRGLTVSENCLADREIAVYRKAEVAKLDRFVAPKS